MAHDLKQGPSQPWPHLSFALYGTCRWLLCQGTSDWPKVRHPRVAESMALPRTLTTASPPQLALCHPAFMSLRQLSASCYWSSWTPALSQAPASQADTQAALGALVLTAARMHRDEHRETSEARGPSIMRSTSPRCNTGINHIRGEMFLSHTNSFLPLRHSQFPAPVTS